MLSKNYRLTKDYDFRRVKRYGNRVASLQFALSWTPNKLAVSRFGFIASKKLGKAAKRHRAVRLLRESVRLNLDKIESGFDVVIVARSGVLGRSFNEVDVEVRRLLAKAGLLSSKCKVQNSKSQLKV